jgi:hypothetical protein
VLWCVNTQVQFSLKADDNAKDDESRTLLHVASQNEYTSGAPRAVPASLIRRVRSSDADTTWVPSGDSLPRRGRGRLCHTRVRVLSSQVPDAVTPVEAL